MKPLRFIIFTLFLCTTLAATHAVSIRENSFQSDCPIIRAQRPFRFTAVIESPGDVEYTCRLVLPEDGSEAANPQITQKSPNTRIHTWDTVCKAPGQKDFTLELHTAGQLAQKITISQAVLPPRAIQKLDYIPEPQPVKTDILVGVHNCPLWEREHVHLWDQVVKKHQERTPAFGLYSQDNPELADWETKWATEHGISFFIYCWYRTSEGGAITTKFEKSVFDDALFLSKFSDKMKFTIMWENQSRGTSGVADEKDLLENLLPYWIEKFFKRENYLKIDNKPVLFVYRPEYLPGDLGSAEAVRTAFDKMREACKEAGFDGLYILGEYRGLDPNHLAYMKQLGMDAAFPYCIPIGNSPPPEDVINTQMHYIRRQNEMRDILPTIFTLSQAWSGWQDEGSIWKLPPADFEKLLRQAKTYIETEVPADTWPARMVILDNWNEWSEGHYIAPYREYGFGYLDAVRRVFSDADEAHDDLLPEDIGMGPYAMPAELFANRTSWDFRDFLSNINHRQPWHTMMNVRDYARSGDRLHFTSTTFDPAIRVQQSELPAADFSKLYVRMKTNVAQPDALQFFWRTTDGADYSEEASVTATVSPGEGYADYILDLKSNPRWNGKITELRLDPVSTKDISVEIEQIELR